jgi:hypothetical protein
VEQAQKVRCGRVEGAACDSVLTSDSNAVDVVWHHALLLEDLIQLWSGAVEDNGVQASVRVEKNER